MKWEWIDSLDGYSAYLENAREEKVELSGIDVLGHICIEHEGKGGYPCSFDLPARQLYKWLGKQLKKAEKEK